jgi:hypothetical protein
LLGFVLDLESTEAQHLDALPAHPSVAGIVFLFSRGCVMGARRRRRSSSFRPLPTSREGIKPSFDALSGPAPSLQKLAEVVGRR